MVANERACNDDGNDILIVRLLVQDERQSDALQMALKAYILIINCDYGMTITITYYVNL